MAPKLTTNTLDQSITNTLHQDITNTLDQQITNAVDQQITNTLDQQIQIQMVNTSAEKHTLSPTTPHPLSYY